MTTKFKVGDLVTSNSQGGLYRIFEVEEKFGYVMYKTYQILTKVFEKPKSPFIKVIHRFGGCHVDGSVWGNNCKKVDKRFVNEVRKRQARQIENLTEVFKNESRN